jgi:hypothetical protein
MSFSDKRIIHICSYLTGNSSFKIVAPSSLGLFRPVGGAKIKMK